LRPALEFVHRRCYPSRRVEVANWNSPTTQNRLRIPGASIWCYCLDRDDYDSVADPTNYTPLR
jgi:hypothetical protein